MPVSATADSLSPAIYQNIARQIREGSCVLFLGPGAMTAQQPDGSWRPLSELCALHLAKDLGLPEDEGESLAQVTTMLRLRGALSDTLIIAAVQDFYQRMEKEAKLPPILEKLADLPFRIVVNTAPDDFFARFYAQSVRDYRFDFYNFRKPAPDPLYKFGENDPPLIYNLFGSYKKPESLTLTYADQLAYVNKITGAQHERLPDSLLAAFSVPRFYLFLGFDFEDWTMRLLLDALFKNARSNITPFAYPLKGEPPAGAKARVFFQSEFRMEFPQLDLETFANQLLTQYAALDGATGDGSGSSDATRANVLILHNESTDDDGCKTLLNYLKPLKVRTSTLKDATGQGDLTAWLRQQLDESQVVLPLISADFFADGNPALDLLTDIAQRNNPRNKFLVMPIVLKAFSLDGTPLAPLKTTRPTGGLPVYGEGKEESHFAAIVQALKNYLDSIG
jgi:hypothetical protein